MWKVEGGDYNVGISAEPATWTRELDMWTKVTVFPEQLQTSLNFRFMFVQPHPPINTLLMAAHVHQLLFVITALQL